MQESGQRRAEDLADERHDRRALEIAELQDRLAQERQYLAEAQRLTHTGSWAWESTSGNYAYCSEEMFRIYGFDPQEGLPTRQEVLGRILPEDRDRVEGSLQESLREKADTAVEYRIMLPDGSVKHIHMIQHPVLDGAGDVVRLVGTSVDVTQRKRAEQALRRSEAYLAETQRLTHTGTYAADPTTKPLYWSEELFRIFGLDPQHGLPTVEEPLRRIHPEDLDNFWQAFQRAIHEKVDLDCEYRIVLPDGTVKHVYGLAHPVLNANGELVESMGTVIDITERKRAEEERERLRRLEADLRHLNRVSMMGELAASVAHEVNQPLSGVVSNAGACLRWLAGDAPNLDEAREAARRIVRDGKRAAEIVARIRALATNRAATHKEELDLNEAIGEVLALAGDQAKRKSVIIRTQFLKDLPPVSGDRVQLQQVVLNLLVNALEAMSGVSEGPRELAITTRSLDADQVEVTIEDSGTGLDPNTTARIFEPFYTTKSGGMGMGLSISRSILEAHGGRIWATAKDGPGTIFRFTLPKHRKEQSHGQGGGF